MDSKNTQTAAQKRTKAINFATLRAVVAGYLIYLGGSLIYDLLKGRATMSPVLVWGIGLLFIAAGVGYGLYIWKRWQADSSEETAEHDAADE